MKDYTFEKETQKQVDICKSKFPETEWIKLENYIGIIHVPNFKISDGWNKEKIDIYFEIPFGYPYTSPQNFYTNDNLRTKNGGWPCYSDNRCYDAMFEYKKLSSDTTKNYLWHMCNLYAWSPINDNLLTYVRVIQNRFRHIR